MISDKRVVIQQPFFLPWLGYFAKIFRSDVIFVLDKAPFRRNYYHRTSILEPNGGKHFLTCPVGASQGTPLSEIKIPEDPSYIDKFLKTIKYSYSKAEYFKSEYPFIESTLNLYRNGGSLAEVNVKVLSESMKYFNLEDCQIILESNFDLPVDKDNKTIRIMDIAQANKLVCGDGVSTLVHDLDLIKNHGISIEILPYYSNHPEYTQVHRVKSEQSFLPGLSFIDALLNNGMENTKELIKSIELKNEIETKIQVTSIR